ncbi:hypothetical protein EDB89DRAFT_1985446 [Lactarius sanguifluus]|nr:hypothetical protein EDB89DRAFT_1985446 [Lactarius sanguifluus]
MSSGRIFYMIWWPITVFIAIADNRHLIRCVASPRFRQVSVIAISKCDESQLAQCCRAYALIDNLYICRNVNKSRDTRWSILIALYDTWDSTSC